MAPRHLSQPQTYEYQLVWTKFGAQLSKHILQSLLINFDIIQTVSTPSADGLVLRKASSHCLF